jgi:hypothetical protein
MELTIATEDGFTMAEGQPGQPFLAQVDDTNRLIEFCLSYRVTSALLYPPNMTPAFFDLSSREAGNILQKLQNYRIRLAVVCAPGSVTLSSLFRDLLVEARRGRDFGLFETRDAAMAWLGQP